MHRNNDTEDKVFNIETQYSCNNCDWIGAEQEMAADYTFDA